MKHTFEEFIGNESIVRSIQTAITRETVSQAYILDGGKGVGKSLLASTIAKTLQCEAGSVTPCLSCLSCKTFESGNHPDIFYPVPTKTKALGVDDVREQIIRPMEVKPYQYPRKIFIVENAGEMTIAAQNALLKTLEEPPEYGIIILLTEHGDSFLPTIRSRCVYYKIKPLPLPLVKKYLLSLPDLSLSEEESQMFSVYGQGSIGQSLALRESESFMATRDKVIGDLSTLREKDIIEVLALAKQWEQYKNNIQEVLDIAFLLYRDVAIAIAINREPSYEGAKKPDRILQLDKKQEIQYMAERLPLLVVTQCLDAIWETKGNLRYNANFTMAVECLLLRLCGEMKE